MDFLAEFPIFAQRNRGTWPFSSNLDFSGGISYFYPDKSRNLRFFAEFSNFVERNYKKCREIREGSFFGAINMIFHFLLIAHIIDPAGFRDAIAEKIAEFGPSLAEFGFFSRNF